MYVVQLRLPSHTHSRMPKQHTYICVYVCATIQIDWVAIICVALPSSLPCSSITLFCPSWLPGWHTAQLLAPISKPKSTNYGAYKYGEYYPCLKHIYRERDTLAGCWMNNCCGYCLRHAVACVSCNTCLTDYQSFHTSVFLLLASFQ